MKIDLTVKESNIDNDFKRIAHDLMNHWVLKIESKLYRIAEIEFYLKSKNHNDTYTHGISFSWRKKDGIFMALDLI